MERAVETLQASLFEIGLATKLPKSQFMIVNPNIRFLKVLINILRFYFWKYSDVSLFRLSGCPESLNNNLSF